MGNIFFAVKGDFCLKKFICFCIFCFSFLFFAFSGCVKDLPIEFKNCDLEVFCATDNQPTLSYQSVKNGNGIVYFGKYLDQGVFLKSLNNIEGITYVLQGDYSLFCTIKNKLSVKCIENTLDSCVGYSDYFNMSTFYKGEKVNVQMCFSKDKIFIGTPLILGCY